MSTVGCCWFNMESHGNLVHMLLAHNSSSGPFAPSGSPGTIMDLTFGSNQTGTPAYQPYQIEWSGEVLFRVVTIIIVMVLTLVGNTTLILIITCHPAERRKRVNVFLVNLAVGDLMVCIFTMTTEILFVAFGEWVLGAAACKIIVYGQIATLSSAVFLLTAMSIDRYQVLVQPFRALTGRPRIWKKVTVAWILAFIFAIPQVLIFVQTNEGVHPDGRLKHLCRSQGYTAKWQRKVYFTFLATYILVIPTIIMSFCYLNIIRVVWKRTDSNSDGTSLKVRFRFHRTKSNEKDARNREDPERRVSRDESLRCNTHRGAFYKGQNRLRIPKKLISSSKRNVVKMTLSVIIGFLICWTPYFVVSLCRIYSDYRLTLGVGLAVAEVMALVHSALNPILYGIFCPKHAKAALLRMTRCLHHSSQLDHLDDGVSEDDTTWADPRRVSFAVHGQARLSAWQQMRDCCLRMRRGQGRKRRRCPTLTMDFYQELIPNGHAQQQGAATQAPDTDISDVDGNNDSDCPGSEFNLRPNRHAMSYVVANLNARPPKDCTSTV